MDYTVDDAAYEQLPESIQHLLNALDSGCLLALSTRQQRQIECAIRQVLNDKTLTGLVGK